MQLEPFAKEMHVESWNNSADSNKSAILKAESLSTEKYHSKKVHSGNGGKWLNTLHGHKKRKLHNILLRLCHIEEKMTIFN